MSHFTKIKCKINDCECLLKTLKLIGFSKIEAYENPQNLYGFQGDKREETAEIIIRRKYIGKLSNDLGFKFNGESFDFIVSEFDFQRFNSEWLGKLTQQYGIEVIKKQAILQGYEIETIEATENDEIRVVIQGWS